MAGVSPPDEHDPVFSSLGSNRSTRAVATHPRSPGSFSSPTVEGEQPASWIARQMITEGGEYIPPPGILQAYTDTTGRLRPDGHSSGLLGSRESQYKDVPEDVTVGNTRLMVLNPHSSVSLGPHTDFTYINLQAIAALRWPAQDRVFVQFHNAPGQAVWTESAKTLPECSEGSGVARAYHRAPASTPLAQFLAAHGFRNYARRFPQRVLSAADMIRVGGPDYFIKTCIHTTDSNELLGLFEVGADGSYYKIGLSVVPHDCVAPCGLSFSRIEANTASLTPQQILNPLDDRQYYTPQEDAFGIGTFIKEGCLYTPLSQLLLGLAMTQHVMDGGNIFLTVHMCRGRREDGKPRTEASLYSAGTTTQGDVWYEPATRGAPMEGGLMYRHTAGAMSPVDPFGEADALDGRVISRGTEDSSSSTDEHRDGRERHDSSTSGSPVRPEGAYHSLGGRQKRQRHDSTSESPDGSLSVSPRRRTSKKRSKRVTSRKKEYGGIPRGASRRVSRRRREDYQGERREEYQGEL